MQLGASEVLDFAGVDGKTPSRIVYLPSCVKLSFRLFVSVLLLVRFEGVDIGQDSVGFPFQLRCIAPSMTQRGQIHGSLSSS